MSSLNWLVMDYKSTQDKNLVEFLNKDIDDLV